MNQSIRCASQWLQLLASAFVLCSPAIAQNFSGTFSAQSDSGQSMTLTLVPDGAGMINGALVSEGSEFPLQARLEAQSLAGVMQIGTDSVLLQAALQEPVLYLALYTLTPIGEIDPDSVTELYLERTGEGARGAAGGPVLPAGPASGKPVQPGESPSVTGDATARGGSSLGLPLAPGFTEDHPGLNDWFAGLSGRKLTQMDSYSSSGGGYSSRKEAVLCSDRTFVSSSSSSVSADVGGVFGNSNGSGNGQGRWTLITNGQVVGLVLAFNDGSTLEYQLQYNGSELYANGERTFVTPAEICY